MLDNIKCDHGTVIMETTMLNYLTVKAVMSTTNTQTNQQNNTCTHRSMHPKRTGKATGAKCSELANLGKGYMGIHYTIISAFW